MENETGVVPTALQRSHFRKKVVIGISILAGAVLLFLAVIFRQEILLFADRFSKKSDLEFTIYMVQDGGVLLRYPREWFIIMKLTRRSLFSLHPQNKLFPILRPQASVLTLHSCPMKFLSQGMKQILIFW
jgi:hypothetical protein